MLLWRVRCCDGELGVVMAGEVLLWRVRCCYGELGVVMAG